MKNLTNSIKEVFSNKGYILLSFLFFILFVVFNLLVINYKVLFSNFSISFMYHLIIGGINSTTMGSFVSLIIISILSGILISMVIHKVRSVSRFSGKSDAVGGFAVILGSLVPACGACGIGLLALLGYGGLLVGLPFAGLELAGLSIVLLFIAIFIISKQIQNKSCKIK